MALKLHQIIVPQQEGRVLQLLRCRTRQGLIRATAALLPELIPVRAGRASPQEEVTQRTRKAQARQVQQRINRRHRCLPTRVQLPAKAMAAAAPIPRLRPCPHQAKPIAKAEARLMAPPRRALTPALRPAAKTPVPQIRGRLLPETAALLNHPLESPALQDNPQAHRDRVVS